MIENKPGGMEDPIKGMQKVNEVAKEYGVKVKSIPEAIKLLRIKEAKLGTAIQALEEYQKGQIPVEEEKT